MADRVRPSSNFPDPQGPSYSAIAEKVIFFPFTLVGYLFEFLAACIVIPIQFIASRLFPSTDPESQAPHDRANRCGAQALRSERQSPPCHSGSFRPADPFEELKKEFPLLDRRAYDEMRVARVTLDEMRANLRACGIYQQIPMTGDPIALEDYVRYRFREIPSDIAAQQRLRSISQARGLNAFHKISGDGNCFLYACIAGLMHMCKTNPAYKQELSERIRILTNEINDKLYLHGFNRDLDLQSVLDKLVNPNTNLLSDELAAPFSRILRFILHHNTIVEEAGTVVPLEDKGYCESYAMPVFNRLFGLNIPCFNTRADASSSALFVAFAAGNDSIEVLKKPSPFNLFHIANHFICGYHMEDPPRAVDPNLDDILRLLPKEALEDLPILERGMSVKDYNDQSYGGPTESARLYHQRFENIANFYGLEAIYRARGNGNCFANAAVGGLVLMLDSDPVFKERLLRKLNELQGFQIPYIAPDKTETASKEERAFTKEGDFDSVLRLLNQPDIKVATLMDNQRFLAAFARIVRYALIAVVPGGGGYFFVPNMSGQEIYMDAIRNLNEFFDINCIVAVIVGNDETPGEGPNQFYHVSGRLEHAYDGVITREERREYRPDFVILRKAGHFDLGIPASDDQ